MKPRVIRSRAGISGEVRILLVGFGFMGKMHAAVYRQLKGVSLAGVVDPRIQETQKHLRSMKMEAPVFRDLESAKSVPCHAVDICLPTDLHASAVAWAAGQGKHIFCEKSMALNLAQAGKMIHQVKQAGVHFQVGHCIRFWPEYQALEKFIASGRGGRLLSLSLQRRTGRPHYSQQDWLNGSRRSGGAALDLHIHDTDFVHHLLGQPRSVQSIGTRDRTGWSHIFTQYEYPSVAVTAEGGWNYPTGWGFQMAFQAVFARGAMEYDSRANPSLSVVLGKAGRKAWTFATPRGGRASGAGGNLSSLGGYFNELASFVQSLRTGRRPEVATGPQAAKSLATVLAEIKSARTGRRVRIPSRAFLE